MTLPQFLCVGAQKAGTTTLQAILQQHPKLYLPSVKETHFFDNGKFGYSRGIEWYASEYFASVREGVLPGEISTNYMFLEYVPKRIFEALGPETKLIFMLRDPVVRSFSQYMMNRRNMLETESFERALERESERARESEFNRKIFGYTERGLYAEQIERFLEYFPKEQMFFVVFETEFVARRDETMRRMCDFLGVEPYAFDTDIVANPMARRGSVWLHRVLYDPAYAWLRRPMKWMIGSEVRRERLKHRLRTLNRRKIAEGERPVMAPETRRRLAAFFRSDIERLEAMTGKDLSHWSRADG